MCQLKVDNYIIDKPIIDILYRLQTIITNGKLKDIKQSATDITVTCPIHDGGHEHNPDCHINIASNNKVPYGYFHCFACGASGGFDKFVAAVMDCSEEYAKHWLISNYGKLAYEKLDLGEDINIYKSKIVRKLDKSVLDTMQHYCPYLAKRKLSKDICEMFNVRYDAVNREVVFPIYDIHENLVMLAKRKIDFKMFHMDKDVEKPVYCLNYIMKNNIKTALITEGPFDCLTAYEYGFPAIATLGAISDKQIELINKSGINVLYLMCDNDAAGQKFNQLLQTRLDSKIITIPVRLPAGKKDINDLSKEEMVNCIKTAKNNF